MPKMSVFFAQVVYSYGGGWATGSTAVEALRKARQFVGITPRELRAAVHYVLEFPDDSEITVSELDGGWSATKTPIGVVVRHMIPGDVNLLGAAPQATPVL